MRNKFVLNEEDIELITSDEGTHDNEEVSFEETIPETSEVKNEQEKIGVSQLLSSLIKDEWEAIDGYKSVIATLKSFGGYEDIIKVLEDIFPEELVHVGQLEKVMELVTPQAKEILDGQDEAAEQLNEPTSEKNIEESCKKKSKHSHKLKEDFTYSGKGYEDYIAYWMDEALAEVDYLISDGDNDDEEVQKLRMLNEAGIETICNEVASDITNSDYLWEQINERISDSIYENIDEVVDNDEYIKSSPTELDPSEVESHRNDSKEE